MAKSKLLSCVECGWTTAKWVGRCGGCGGWSTVSEAAPAIGGQAVAPASRALPILEIDASAADGVPTGIAEFDRVLGAGLTPGGVVLLAGEPGVGKTTLLLQVAAGWARQGRKALYITAEESAAQVKARAERVGAACEGLYLACESDLAVVLGHVEQLRPELLVLDSVQTVAVPEGEGVPGGVTQIKEVAVALGRVARQYGMPVLLVGHVTKEGAVAGPRTLEHLVDVVLSFEGDASGLRVVRASKNRFGPADEIGCFQMAQAGLLEVPDPTGLFVSQSAQPAPGSCLTVTQEGRRSLLVEMQALVGVARTPGPRRVCHGVDLNRVLLILAVLMRRAKLRLAEREVYVSTVRGARVGDPAADLAI
ncbi:MAG: DNA repair protein RadA, partial [Propionibacteriaceae bacterium]|nr:DNA repair protein RadA [Propionibacteriaceae bacterium]